MGPQQVLLIILAFCILGICVSSGIIGAQSSNDVYSRSLITEEFFKMVKQARVYRSIPYENDGGDGTFFGLTATPQGIARLTSTPVTSFAKFIISRNGNEASVEVTAVGSVPGRDNRTPIRMQLVVSEHTFSIADLN